MCLLSISLVIALIAVVCISELITLYSVDMLIIDKVNRRLFLAVPRYLAIAKHNFLFDMHKISNF